MPDTSSQTGRFKHTEAFSADPKNVHVIIEAPQGKRNKYKYDETQSEQSNWCMRVWHALSRGALPE